jgi:uncharacterized protein (TIGR03437 family)
MHGNTAVIPLGYEDWIYHIARRGNIVIYPRYQSSIEFTGSLPDAITAIKSALDILGSAADLDKFAFVAHSFGGILTFNIAALAQAEGLPTPKALIVTHPGPSILANYGTFNRISSKALVLILVGDDDNVVGQQPGINIMASLPHIQAKNLVVVQSDYHGDPPLSANHFAPGAPIPNTNALDYYAYWKLSDALIDLAFYGIEGEIALGGGDQQIHMGAWSDGVPVKTLQLRPTISLPGIVNAATLQPGNIAPGELVLVTGAGLGPKPVQTVQLDSQGRLTRSLSGTRVLFNGVASPLVYSHMNQVAAIVPYGISGRSTATVQVESGNYASGSVTVNLAASAPGIFTADGSGSGQGAILNQNFSSNSSRNPAAKGSQIIIFATGEGDMVTPVTEGALVSALQTRPRLPVSVRVAGIPVEVTYAGLAPGLYAGMLQLNVRLPEDIPSGNLPVVLTVGNATSQSNVTVAVK